MILLALLGVLLTSFNLIEFPATPKADAGEAQLIVTQMLCFFSLLFLVSPFFISGFKPWLKCPKCKSKFCVFVKSYTSKPFQKERGLFKHQYQTKSMRKFCGHCMLYYDQQEKTTIYVPHVD
jgi:hypothetical protein